jgi:ssDNA-binding Zn-finger/Zn-ribbon topoisomerase 1
MALMAVEDYFDLYPGEEEPVDDSITNLDEERDYVQMLHDGNCAARVVLRMNKRGQTFWGCNAFPKHRWTHKRVR